MQSMISGLDVVTEYSSIEQTCFHHPQVETLFHLNIFPFSLIRNVFFSTDACKFATEQNFEAQYETHDHSNHALQALSPGKKSNPCHSLPTHGSLIFLIAIHTARCKQTYTAANTAPTVVLVLQPARRACRDLESKRCICNRLSP